jgi:flagellar biosynthesis repressor protein FlbT
MALRVELKPGERIIIGESVITNDNQRTRLYIDGDAPILREKDILTVATANSPAKRIYLAVQLMYLSRSIEKMQDDYLTFVRDLIEASPSSTPFITRVSANILSGNLYKALKEAKILIEYEEQLFSHATSGSDSLSDHQSKNCQSA